MAGKNRAFAPEIGDMDQPALSFDMGEDEARSAMCQDVANPAEWAGEYPVCFGKLHLAAALRTFMNDFEIHDAFILKLLSTMITKDRLRQVLLFTEGAHPGLGFFVGRVTTARAEFGAWHQVLTTVGALV
jgi:hypothetical protein